MTQVSTITHKPRSRVGGRVSSPELRASHKQREAFTGLEAGVQRYDLLHLVKRVGKSAGFTPRMIQLLEYYLSFTQEIDFAADGRPIVYQSLARTALDLGVNERQIQRLEQKLFRAGAITFNDSGNHKRYGKRDPVNGRILFAFGVDLTPLTFLKSDLETKLQEKQLYEEAWLAAKREITRYRRGIRSMLLEGREAVIERSVLLSLEARYQEIAIQIRTHIKLEQLRALLLRHQELYSQVMEVVVGDAQKGIELAQDKNLEKSTPITTSGNVIQDVHKENTNPINKDSCSLNGLGFQEKRSESSEPEDLILATGLQHISLKQVLHATSNRFRAYLPIDTRSRNWSHVVEAAYRLRGELQISQKSWSEACQALGRIGAAICLIITERGMQRQENPVRQPAAYFRGMVKRVATKELKLHNSIFGLLEARN